jgi:four helix bundle protein
MRDFIAYQIALQAARSLGGCLTAIRKRDRDLDRQVRRATQSFVLNLAEGDRRRGQDRIHLFRIAAGSAAEVMAALELAVAWGYLTEGQAEPAKELLDRLLAVCWRLTERGKPGKEVRQVS